MTTTTTPRRRRMTAEARREQILDVVHGIVATEGFHAATPNRIAAEADVTRPVLYQQFGDLPTLFVALIDREAARLTTQFAEAEEVAPRDPDPFVHTFEAALRAIDAHPMTWRLFLLPPEGAPPELHQRLAGAQETVRVLLESLVRDAFPELPDPDYTARMLHAAGRELLRLRLIEPGEATSERLGALIRNVRTMPSAASGHGTMAP